LISKGLALYIMSLQQAKFLLNKINTLYNSVEVDGQVSSIERDLMLSYVRQFYEAFLSTDEVLVPSAPISAPVIVPPPPAPAPIQKPIEVVVVPPPIPTPAPAPVIELEIQIPTPPRVEPVVIAPVAIPTPQPVFVETPKPAPPVEIVKPFAQTVFPEPPKPKAAQKPLIKPANERVDQSELFEEKMKKELSDKLGEMPIDDIRKAMGLNEKIIFLNDLFDGNQHEFDTAVSTLNNVGSYEAAKNHLALLASRFDWASKEKQAKPFIRLVKRRYNN
jgi:hypothetical protein